MRVARVADAVRVAVGLVGVRHAGAVVAIVDAAVAVLVRGAADGRARPDDERVGRERVPRRRVGARRALAQPEHAIAAREQAHDDHQAAHVGDADTTIT